MAIENQDTFTFGIITACIGVALIFFPVYEYAPRVVGLLRYFGVILTINAGILMLMSGVWDSEDIFRAGFGVGMGAIGLLIGSEIGNVVDIVMTMARVPMNTLFLLILFSDDPYSQFLVILTTPATIRDLNFSMVRAIVTFVLAGVVLVLEIIALQKAKKGI
ncbi:MAG: hypothetical protein HWN67_02510 [Candidatus Helarchaeota archaeon]|nr:hypothetical protein [Candidatus Helarchaeota archaeon]